VLVCLVRVASVGLGEQAGSTDDLSSAYFE
jgi:hypothetical protein